MLTTYALQFPGVGCSLLTDFKLNVGFQKVGKQWRQLSLEFRPKSFLDIVKVYYTNSTST